MTTPMLLSPLVFLVVFGLTGGVAGAVYSRTWRGDRSIFVDAAMGGVGWLAVWVVYWFLVEEWPSPLWSLRQAALALLVSIGVVHLITVGGHLSGRHGSNALESVETGEIPPRG